MEITRKEQKIEFNYNLSYRTDIGWVHNVRLVISIHYHFGYKLYYDLYQDIIEDNYHKEVKIYEYQYEVKDNLLYFLVMGLHKNEVCGETKKSYENYLFNLFNDNNKWIEELQMNHKNNPTYYKENEIYDKEFR